MTFTLLDVSGVLAAVLACGVLLALPGLALAEATDALHARRLPTAASLAVGLLLAYALLPLLDSLVARWLGLCGALALHLGLAAAGAATIHRRGLPRLGRVARAAVAAWLVLILVCWVDVDWNGRLFPSLLMLDTVKHAATVRALLEGGTVPPLDPFFLRDEPAGYYYFFYVASALAVRLTGGLADARAAVAGQIFWTGLALFSLLRLLLHRLRLPHGGSPVGARTGLLLALMGAGGLQLVPTLVLGGATGVWLGQVNWWNEQVTSLPLSLLWVPHHVAGLIAAWTGVLLLAPHVAQARLAWAPAGAAALAGMAFASAAGLSIWVTLAAALAMSLWAGRLALQRRWQALALVLASGGIALVFALPFLLDLLHYRNSGQSPVALTVRAFPFTDALLSDPVARTIARLLALPLDYALEFGLLALGAVAYWRLPPATPFLPAARELRALLALSAAAGMLLASFARSTIVNNDLAWRAILFAQVAAILWSTAAFAPLLRAPGAALRAAPAYAVLVAVLSYGAVVYDLVALRAFDAVGLGGEAGMRRDPVVDHDTRSAYAWLAASAHGPRVAQHNPAVERAFGYGLYGRSPVAVADHHNALIFGAAPAAVATRLAAIEPIFAGTLSAHDAATRLATHRIATLVVTRADPVWHDPTAWIWRLPPLFASPTVRILGLGAP